MSFDKVETTVDFPAFEREMLAFWDKTDAFNTLRKLREHGPRWSFLDGPITANNPMGVHHAWGRTYKDVYQRFHAMLGEHQRYQNGFDCQGLWVEVEVEKELKLNSKRDIETLIPGDAHASLDKFVTACKDRVNKFARMQTEQSIRLGFWMDWDRTDADWAKAPGQRKSYFTMSEENNYTIWSFLKKCHGRNLIYRGFDSMPWCGRCGTGISQMEMNEGYKITVHRSVFVKFPLRNKPNEFLLVWTTTPWTLSSNVAAAVNPELTYVQVKSGGQIYYVAKGALKVQRLEEQFKSKTEWVEGIPKLRTLEQFFKEKNKEGYEIVGEVKGAELVGLQYDGPFDEFTAQTASYGYPAEVADAAQKRGWNTGANSKDGHRVIAWKDVGETEGTGIVHIAPGCGAIDFELGKENGLPPIAPLDEYGNFLPGFGELSGKNAVDATTADAVFDSLQKKGLLFAIEKYPHKYPHCWRCKTELLFRLVDEWFIQMTWRDEIKRVVDKITWLPESVNGRAREQDWLTNMGDWMISKKRFWGLALPIWVDEATGDFEVIGSREELKQRAVEGWEQFEGKAPHRPWIDKVKIKNPKTGNLMTRIGDVGNPWLDAGIVAFSTVGYNTDKNYWKKWYPTDFITESFPGQFRNWFYSVLAMSTMMNHGTDQEESPPFKTLLGFATVMDQFGHAMHKTAGNSIEFIGAANDGFELFYDLDTGSDTKKAFDKLPKGHLSSRTEEVTQKDGSKKQRLFAKYKPIGADVIRWMYCRHNPASNINFGPETADEVRAKFILKLWNTYAFFCNYARLDGFDHATPQVPVTDRPDIDRWILSDLQLLVQHAKECYTKFDVMDFCLEMENFIDDRLSNWYVRRNRRRFWKSEQGSDKTAAYQTLYTVLFTVTKLIAPVVPFLAEKMYQNLKKPSDPVSVHHLDFPKAEVSQIDEALSADMNALLDLKTLGGAARNAAKINLRQPLAELKVLPADESHKQAVLRFEDQLREELNVKKVSLADAASGSLMTAEAKLNMKTAAAKLGPKLNDAKAFLASCNAQELGEQLKSGPVTIAGVALEAADVQINFLAPTGWAGVAEKGTQVLIDSRITPELEAEGLARDIIRYVQDARKNANLEMQDRIVLSLETDSAKLNSAIETHRDYIATETLVATWATPPGDPYSNEVKIDGQKLAIKLAKA